MTYHFLIYRAYTWLWQL